jgi:hypothetical protein
VDEPRSAGPGKTKCTCIEQRRSIIGLCCGSRKRLPRRPLRHGSTLPNLTTFGTTTRWKAKQGHIRATQSEAAQSRRDLRSRWSFRRRSAQGSRERPEAWQRPEACQGRRRRSFAGPPDLARQRERLPELKPDLTPRSHEDGRRSSLVLLADVCRCRVRPTGAARPTAASGRCSANSVTTLIPTRSQA